MSLAMKVKKFRATFIEPSLGTKSSDPKVMEKWIAGKAPDPAMTADEVNSTAELEASHKSVFSRNADGNPVIWDYMVKGFFKAAGEVLRTCSPNETRDGASTLKKWSGIRGKIDKMLFIYPRKIELNLPAGEVVGEITRPRRGQTPMGETVSLACSELVPIGTSFDFELKWMEGDALTEAMITDMVAYGELSGIGAWRNASWGRFSVEEVK